MAVPLSSNLTLVTRGLGGAHGHAYPPRTSRSADMGRCTLTNGHLLVFVKSIIFNCEKLALRIFFLICRQLLIEGNFSGILAKKPAIPARVFSEHHLQ